MRVGLVIVAAFFAAAVMLVLGAQLLTPERDLLLYAEFNLTTISPNADGRDDITQFSYEITQAANVTLAFEAQNGDIYYFRQAQPRGAGAYAVLFSGVVDGFSLPDDPAIDAEILRRLIPNGEYIWTFTVQTDDGETATQTGTLNVVDGDSQLPWITEFSVSPEVFTPNQDGISDRTSINVYIEKDVEALDVYLLDAENRRIPVVRREEGREVNQAGRHTYDYEGGVDIGADPPPNGDYLVVAEAQDAEGQVIRRVATLTIADGGKPRGEIVAQTVGATVVFVSMPYDERYYSDAEHLGELIPMPDRPGDTAVLPVTMAVGDMLVFRLTVENYGEAPIRTSGPPPGTVYQQTQRAASLGAMEQSGVWRVGIDCESAPESYPWRWAIGSAEDLVERYDPVSGNTYLYLEPGRRAEVWGAIRMTELIEAANPMNCWAGLIHEDVDMINNVVGAREIELADLTTQEDN
ncbi:MAG: hypothetical protein CUN56_09720 [Phototrophicales bacterium]|nr:MAG: hypothetical protein CUN56_09720 [Phototrophicales bacterium]RMG76080.1 MAG: hypothetical protein D6711_04980 [Chloroflexota bacterium]